MASQDLDAILQQALEEFTEDEPTLLATPDLRAASDRAARAAACVPSPSLPSSPLQDDSAASLEQLMRNIGGEDFKRQLASMMSESSAGGSSTEGTTGSDEIAQDKDLLRTLELLQRLASGAAPMVDGASSQAPGAASGDGVNEGLSEDDLKRITEELGRLGDASGLPSGIDGMMHQLVSREVMYEPMKAIAGRLPSWLSENASRLEAADRTRYEAQLKAYQRVLDAYDAETVDSSRIMELISDLTAFGQPPPEIVSELEASSDGPQLPGGGGQGLPAGGPECAVM